MIILICKNIIGNELIGSQTQITFDGDTGTNQGTSENVIVHGNNVHGTIEWDPAFADHFLPASFYPSSKPTFYGAVQWPSLGGDMDPGTGTIPAKDRFDRKEFIPQPSSYHPIDDMAPEDDETSTDIGGGTTSTTAGETTDSDSSSGGSSSGGCFIGSVDRESE
jgi:hypothetical protein